jgi:hypothetical protein
VIKLILRKTIKEAQMPGCMGVKVEAGESPALYRNCKPIGKPGNLL